MAITAILPIHHIGIAVQDLDSAIAKYRNDIGFDLEIRETIESQKVEIAFLSGAGTLIELLQPLGEESPLARFLQKRGPGLHHICYQVEDIELELIRFRSMGYELIDDLPRRGAHNSRIAFIHPKSMGGVLTELCQPA